MIYDSTVGKLMLITMPPNKAEKFLSNQDRLTRVYQKKTSGSYSKINSNKQVHAERNTESDPEREINDSRNRKAEYTQPVSKNGQLGIEFK